MGVLNKELDSRIFSLENSLRKLQDLKPSPSFNWASSGRQMNKKQINDFNSDYTNLNKKIDRLKENRYDKNTPSFNNEVESSLSLARELTMKYTPMKNFREVSQKFFYSQIFPNSIGSLRSRSW